ncbi:MAG TPA: beta-ketoacyl-[acyl-carrier-protein] synthase family protein [Verrucomicrobiae bacterium]
MREPNVVIAGCDVISAVGCGLEPLRDALKKNLSGLCANEKFNSARFQSNIVGAVSRDFFGDGSDDPAFQLAAVALNQARESSRHILEKIPVERIGLVLSTTKANIIALERISENRSCSDIARRHLQGNFLAEDLAAEQSARGPVQCVSTACVSGLIAIQQGAKIIERGEADAMFIVGVDCISEFVMAGFTALKALDPNGCRPFDANRCGLSPGEAGAAIILARENFATDSTIKIRGWGGSNDANHLTGPSRDGSGLAQAIRCALASAKLSPQEIDYVNAHGTGTPYNDAMESMALRSVFGGACPPFSGLKGMLGHTLGAAGVLETICCALAMRENFLPGTPRLNTPADGVPASIVRESRAVPKLKHVLKLNTGFGGANGALILSHG